MTAKATNITWHKGLVTPEDRARLNGHGGAVLWFTGLPSSGKSTLACEVERLLFSRACRTFILDGDNIRHGLNKNLGFTPEDRMENIRRIGEVSRLFADAGLIVMTAFISPYAADRRSARGLLPPGKFIEVFCRCPLSACEARDPKGLYKKARAGLVKDFTGVDAPYEEPAAPEITVDTGSESLDRCAAQIIGYLEQEGVVPRQA